MKCLLRMHSTPTTILCTCVYGVWCKVQTSHFINLLIIYRFASINLLLLGLLVYLQNIISIAFINKQFLNLLISGDHIHSMVCVFLVTSSSISKTLTSWNIVNVFYMDDDGRCRGCCADYYDYAYRLRGLHGKFFISIL